STSVSSAVGTPMTYPPVDAQPLVALLAPRIAACAGSARIATWELAIALDTTGTEIVDVAVHPAVSRDTTIADAAAVGGAAFDRFTACVEDAAWELDLDDRFARPTGHYAVTVAGPR
ncbi:MAG: hypothetical protein K8W52_33105, partial [Deltaproteobacteria bacterium]|nr:hypothetical protein [Deltaproteobacteria bacterium]